MKFYSPDKNTFLNTWKILVIDDDEDDFLIVKDMLKEAKGRKYDLHWASSYKAGFETLYANQFNAVLVDYDLGPHTGIELIREANKRGCDVPLILFTGRGTYEVDVEAMEAGATLYLTKGEANTLLLERSIRYAIELKQREHSLRESEAEIRKNSEALRVSEERFQKAFNASPNAQVVSRMEDGRIDLINDSFEQLFGYNRDEVIGKTSLELRMFANPDDREEAVRRLQTNESLRDFELEIRTKSGAVRKANLSIENISIGNEHLMLTVIQDITERKQAEEALRAMTNKVELDRNRLAAILNQLPVGVWIADQNGRLIEKNEQADRIWAGEAPLLDSMNQYQEYIAWYADTGKKLIPNDYPLARALLTGQLVGPLELRIRRFDNTEGYILVSAAPIKDGEGHLTGAVGINVDITRQKQAEQQMEFHASLLLNTHDAVIATDTEQRITAWNKAAFDLYGYEEQEVLGKIGGEVLRSEFTDEQRAMVKRQLAETGRYTVEIAQHTKDGRRIIVEGTVIPRRDGQGKISGYVTANRDITERKRAEEELERAHHDLVNERSRLLAIMEALPIGLAIYDQDGGVIQANPGFEAVWGSPRPAANSVDDYDSYQAWWVETGQRVQPEEWAAAQAVQLEKTVTGQLIRIQKFDGTEGYVLNSGAPVRDAQGQVIGATVAIMDITKLIEAENALRISQDRFRVALKSVPIIVYTCDRELRYTWIYNPLRGFQAEDALGKRDDEIISPEAAEEMIAAKQKALDTGLGDVQEVRVPLKGENTYYILTTEPIRDNNGSVTGLTCSAIDITEQKRMQEAQQEQAVQIEVQRQLMDHREQDRSSMARDLHDGPIQMLSSTIFHLQRIKDIFPDPALQTELNQIGMGIKGTIGELRDLMNDLRPPALITFGFWKVTQQYIEDFRVRFPDLEIELNVEGDDRLLSVAAHLTLFGIFQAGINNIIRHSDASKAWVVIKIEQDSFYFELRDNGVGFDLKRDFSQLTRDGHFGLVGMKERAEAIGAEFSVLSESGKGTAIVVRGRLMEHSVKGTSSLTADS